MRIQEVGGWSFMVSPHTLVNPSHVNESVASFLMGSGPVHGRGWVNSFAYEPTWVQRECGVPSLLVRLDMTVDTDGRFHVFEVEERPGGLAADALVNPDFRERFRSLLAEWRQCFKKSVEVVASPGRTEDLALYTETLGIPVSAGAPASQNSLLIVRANPDEGFTDLRTRSVSPISTKGDKGYGLTLGLWSRARAESLPWDAGFALKASVGSKMHGVWLYSPRHKRGSITQPEAQALLRKQRAHFVQGWIEPESTEQHSWLPDGYLLARRVFFGYSPEQRTYIPLGGFWNARPNIRIHGASDAIVGPILA